MPKSITIIVVLCVLAGGGWLGWHYLAAAQGPDTPAYEAVRVERGTLFSQISATGRIEAEAEVALNFGANGRVAEVHVQSGDYVEAGQLLARLDTRELELAVIQSEANLAQAEARLAQLQKPPDASELAAAEAQLASAQAQHRALLAGPSEDELTSARANLERARIALEQAQAAYDRVAWMPNVGELPQSAQLQQATIDYEVAEAQYRINTRGPDQGQLAQTEAQIAQAQANLARLKEGVAAEEIASAEAQVRQAQASLEQTRLTLDNARIVAPFAGTVAQVNVRVGEMAGQSPAIVLADLSQFHITVNVDEIDIGQVHEGQPVHVVIDALPNANVTGVIHRIDPVPTREGSIVTFRVKILLDETGVALRAGMSAAANIITAQVQDTLLLPNRVILLDRSDGRAYVDRLVGGQVVRTEVQIGLRDETHSQILTGLEMGDEVVLREVGGGDQLRRAIFGGQP